MQEVLKFIIGICVLVLGIPLGDLLARKTKEELKDGQIWFRLIVIISFICAIVAIFLSSDFLLFGFLFMAIVTSRSLIKNEPFRKRFPKRDKNNEKRNKNRRRKN